MLAVLPRLWWGMQVHASSLPCCELSLCTTAFLAQAACCGAVSEQVSLLLAARYVVGSSTND